MEELQRNGYEVKDISTPTTEGVTVTANSKITVLATFKRDVKTTNVENTIDITVKEKVGGTVESTVNGESKDGYYVDVDDDATVDGIIYEDLTVSVIEKWGDSNGNYSYTVPYGYQKPTKQVIIRVNQRAKKMEYEDTINLLAKTNSKIGILKKYNCQKLILNYVNKLPNEVKKLIKYDNKKHKFIKN